MVDNGNGETVSPSTRGLSNKLTRGRASLEPVLFEVFVVLSEYFIGRSDNFVSSVLHRLEERTRGITYGVVTTDDVANTTVLKEVGNGVPVLIVFRGGVTEDTLKFSFGGDEGQLANRSSGKRTCESSNVSSDSVTCPFRKVNLVDHDARGSSFDSHFSSRIQEIFKSI